MSKLEVEETVLELLANAPSSFAALYGFLVRQNEGGRLRVAQVLGVVTELEQRGWIRARRVTPEGQYEGVAETYRVHAEQEYRDWLEAPNANLSVDALSIDEIGLWLEIRPEGRDAWRKIAESEEPLPKWALHQDARTHSITVYAEDVDTAENALLAWLRSNPGAKLVSDSRVMEPVSEFHLNDGTKVAPGVRLQAAYREGATP